MYKNYNMNQITLPLETEILIPDNDISKAVHTLVESMPEDVFDEFGQSQGASSYHPKMMLKILLCAYSQSAFSGRKIEALLQDSIRMMWLAQNQTPRIERLTDSVRIRRWRRCFSLPSSSLELSWNRMA
jgi:Transposase and inactivated derivatives